MERIYLYVNFFGRRCEQREEKFIEETVCFWTYLGGIVEYFGVNCKRVKCEWRGYEIV